MAKKKRYKRYGMRTDTYPIKIVRDLKDGTKYIKRKDGSLIPKHTTIAVNETTKRLLKGFKEFCGYPNINDAILGLLLARKEAEAFPENMIDKAKYESELQRDAREKAIRKGRFKKKKGINPDKFIYKNF